MKKRTLQINIPEPCDQKWSAMTPQGVDSRFCSECERTIVDYTNKTDREIVAAYKKSSGKLCGKFLSTQLNRDLNWNTNISSNAKLKAMGFLFSGLLTTTSLNAQQPISEKEKTEEIVILQKNRHSAKTLFKVKGIILSSKDQEPIIGASISIVGTNKLVITDIDGVLTDIDGVFELTLKQTAQLKISYTGFETRYITVNQAQDNLKIELEEEEPKNEVVVVGLIAPKAACNPIITSKDLDKMSDHKPILKIDKTQLNKIIQYPSSQILEISPNPFIHQLKVVVISESEQLQLILSDVQGRQILKQKINANKGRNQIILTPKKKLPVGTYFMSLLKNNQVIQTETLIKIAE